MSTLIRYEDKYGMAKLFKMLNNLTVESIGDLSLYSQTDLYCRSGLSNAKVMNITKNEVALYKKLNITDIYFVFDMDNDSDNSKIISPETISTRIKWLISLRDIMNWDIEYHFIPVVYTAESIALYQFFSGYRPITFIVNVENTKLLHLNLLHAVTKEKDTKRLKRFEFVDVNKLRSKLRKYKDIDDFNKLSISFLFNEFESIQVLSEQKIISFIKEVVTKFEELKCKECTVKYRSKIYDVSSSKYIDQFRENRFIN